MLTLCSWLSAGVAVFAPLLRWLLLFFPSSSQVYVSGLSYSSYFKLKKRTGESGSAKRWRSQLASWLALHKPKTGESQNSEIQDGACFLPVALYLTDVFCFILHLSNIEKKSQIFLLTIFQTVNINVWSPRGDCLAQDITSCAFWHN